MVPFHGVPCLKVGMCQPVREDLCGGGTVCNNTGKCQFMKRAVLHLLKAVCIIPVNRLQLIQVTCIRLFVLQCCYCCAFVYSDVSFKSKFGHKCGLYNYFAVHMCIQMSRLNRLAYANVAGFSKTLLYQTFGGSPELALAAGINGSRSDHKVALPSSSLAAIPEGTVTSVTSGSGVPSTSSPVPSSSGTGKQASSVRTHQQSTQTTGLVVGGGTSTVQEVGRSSLAADGRSSSPKHSAGSTSVGGTAVGRVHAVDNVIPPTVTAATSIKGPRLLFVVRHGERIDFTFGKDWMQNSFNSAGLCYTVSV